MTKKVCLLDYGSGNVGSVKNLLLALNVDAEVSNRPDDIKRATHLILPGVGSFGSAMEKIRSTIPLDVLEEELFQSKKPFLGICVGFQVMAEKGEEYGDFSGLGWIKGIVSKLASGEFPLPHIGWNNIESISSSPILQGFTEAADFYFAHSFALKNTEESCVKAYTNYGEKFPSIVQKDNLFGVQFHPEKSQRAGRYLFENFLNYS